MRLIHGKNLPAAPDDETLSQRYAHYQLRMHPRVLERLELELDHSKYTVQASMALVLVKISHGLYKFLRDEPGLHHPDVQPCYNLVYNKSLSHTYSLVKDYSAVPQNQPRPYNLRPFFTYQTPSKLFTHGTIFDLTNYAQVEDDPAYGILASKPLSIRVVFGDKYWRREYPTVIARTTTETEYIWSYSEYPPNSKRFVYLMRLSDLRTRGIEIPVAVVAEAHYLSPIDGSPLESIYIDARRVHPGLAALTYFATVHWRKYMLVNSRKLGVPVRNPKILKKVVFEGEGDEVHQPEEYPVEDMHKIFSDVSNDMEQLAAVDDIITVKVFNGNFLRHYDIPRGVLACMNREAGNKILAIKSLHCLAEFL